MATAKSTVPVPARTTSIAGGVERGVFGGDQEAGAGGEECTGQVDITRSG